MRTARATRQSKIKKSSTLNPENRVRKKKPQKGKKNAVDRKILNAQRAVANELYARGDRMNGAELKAVKQLVANMLLPREGFRMPRPAAPLIHPVITRNEVILQAPSSSVGLKVVIAVRQDVDAHINIWAPGATVVINAGSYHNRADQEPGGLPIQVVPGFLYSMPGTLRDGNGNPVVTSKLFDVSDTFHACRAWDPDRKVWVDKKAWAFNAPLNGASHNYNIRAEDTSGISNPGSSTFYMKDLSFNGGVIDQISSTAIALTTGTTGYTDSTASTGPYTGFFIDFSSGYEISSITSQTTNVSISYTGLIEATYPCDSSDAFTTFMTTSRKYCLSAFDALLQFRGGMSDAGSCYCCLLPHGLELSTDPDIALAQIATKPDARKHEGKEGEGGHVSWIPDDIRQLWLREYGTQGFIPSQTIWFVVDCPPAGNLQLPQMCLTVHSNIEGENYEQVYAAKSGSNHGMLLQAVVDCYGTIQPCSGNPNHIQKVKKIITKVASDPTVQMFAKAAWKTAKIVGPMALAAL